jgi:hypothetical protein
MEKAEWKPFRNALDKLDRKKNKKLELHDSNLPSKRAEAMGVLVKKYFYELSEPSLLNRLLPEQRGDDDLVFSWQCGYDSSKVKQEMEEE